MLKPKCQLYFIKTFGCAMNVSDSERIAAFLEGKSLSNSPFEKGRGFRLAKKIEKADLVVFNTCGIKQTAENRAYSFIHNLRKNNKNIKIVLTGCIAHRPDVQKLLKNKVDLFFSINDFEVFENFIACHLDHPLHEYKLRGEISGSDPSTPFRPIGLNYAQDDIAYLSIDPKHDNSYQALVPIMSGCNNFCAYCVVPYARGREVSRETSEIIYEVKSLVKKGYKHIMLLGQNVNSYKSPATLSSSPLREKMSSGTDEGESVNFSQLLKTIDAIPGKFWISFVSSHPKDFDDQLIETIAKCKKVCEWVHLPVQAGNDEVLRRMNRKYTQAHYLGIIKKVRLAFKKYKPDIPYSLTSDIIVGFPGETKKQFLDSAELMEKVKFDMVFFGQFSPRPGTVAWKMKNNVSQKEKVRREKFLNEIIKKTTYANNKRHVGKIMEVLIEKQESPFSKGKTKEGFANSKIPLNPPFEKGAVVYFGKTRTMKNVKIVSNKKYLIGKIMRVKITKANVWNLEGMA